MEVELISISRKRNEKSIFHVRLAFMKSLAAALRRRFSAVKKKVEYATEWLRRNKAFSTL